MLLRFTQYLRPRGHQTFTDIEIGDDFRMTALDLMARGVRFECEILRTDDAVFYALDFRDRGGDR